MQEEPEEEDEDPDSGMGRTLRIMQELDREDREYWEEVRRQEAEQA